MRRQFGVFLVLTGILLSGCANTPEGGADRDLPPVAAVDNDAQMVGRDTATGDVIKNGGGASDGSQLSHSETTPPMPSSRITPEQIVGLSPLTIENIFGPPTFRRQDQRVWVWQYVSPDCVMHVYLYENKAMRSYQVDHIEMHGRDLSAPNPTVSPEACVASHLRP